MFHWICPECGREIAPQAKECPACEAAEVTVPAVLAAKAEIDEPAPLQPRVPGAPQQPASAVPAPITVAGRDLSPVEAAAASEPNAPVWEKTLPVLDPARAPRFSIAPLRESPPPSLSGSHAPHVSAPPEPTVTPTALPVLTVAASPAPPMAALADYASIARSKMKPAIGKAAQTTALAATVKEQLSLPGPTLPHELTSLEAAGVAKILVPTGQVLVAKRSSWALSLVVAAAVIAGTLGAAFYAMPGLASAPAAPVRDVPKEAKSEPVPEPARDMSPLARAVEVTGIRFVTDLPNSPPQIHYLVVNHSNTTLVGIIVNVTLHEPARETGAVPESPLSQFAFKAPRLGPYESKEMVSSIERFNRPVSLPDWRNLQADIQITQ